MLLSTAVGLFLAFWSLLYLTDHYFRARSFNKYVTFVEKTGLIVTPFQIRWYTGRFQNIITSSAILKSGKLRKFLGWWFAVGAAFTVFTMVSMVLFLTRNLWKESYPLLRYLWPGRAEVNLVTPQTTGTTPVVTQESGALIPVIPGVNVPLGQLPVLITVLIFAGVVHELGHAIAAVNENVGVKGFGIFVLAIYPGAFTEIENDSLDSVSLFPKLKIYSAGIWHNFVLALLGISFLLSLPYTMSPGYMVNKGVIVSSVSGHSGLGGPAGLHPGHVVYGINYCKVYNEDTWYGCLNRLTKTNYGYCVPRWEVLSNKSERIRNIHGEFHCCNVNSTQTHLCFYFKTTNDPKLLHMFEYSCLPARYVTDHYVCNHSLPCGSRTLCVYPALFNSTKLLRFFIANQSKPVLFVGFPSEVAKQVSVSSFIPKYPWLPLSVVWGVELFCKYLITFSLALAFLNALPCYSLDGQFVSAVLCEMRHRKWTRRKRTFVYTGILYYGTFLLCANVAVALWKFFRFSI